MEEKTKGASQDDIYLAPEVNENQTAVAPGDAAPLPEDDIFVAEPDKKAFRVNEILSLRGENKKVFRMSDGTEQAVFYPEAVHAFDDDANTFMDVDNHLTAEEDDRHVCNIRGKFKTRFSKEENCDELFSVEDGTHKITVWSSKDKGRHHMRTAPVLQKRRNADPSQPVGEDVVMFAQAFPSVDLEYSVHGNGVKENIIVKEKASEYRFPFIVECCNVTVEHDETEKTVKFNDTKDGTEVFRIPAPFMVDENGVVSTNVFYEVDPLEEGKIILTVIADGAWMNAEERAFPVTIDPQVVVSGNTQMTTYSWDAGTMYTGAQHTVGTSGGAEASYCTASRMYMSIPIPQLPNNPRIKKAELKFVQSAAYSACGEYAKMGLYEVTGGISLQATPSHLPDLLDYDAMKLDAQAEYCFDVTSLVDRIRKEGGQRVDLVLKMLDEYNYYRNTVTLYGASNTAYAPTLCVTYESSYSINSAYRTHTHELGRFGQGSIDLQQGNLMFESEDFAWGGNRMPVALKHMYNSAMSGYRYTANNAIQLHAADFSAMKLGLGWKMNVMRSMVPATFQHDGTAYDGYILVDENGSETYFKKDDNLFYCASGTQCYYLYKDIETGEMSYDPVTRLLTTGSEKLLFDASGRLIRITDEHNNSMHFNYTDGQLISVVDGAGRAFTFSYNEADYLTAITAPDGTCVEYSYSNSLLSGITWSDGRKAEISYSSNYPASVVLKDANNVAVYQVMYTFTNGMLTNVAEFGMENGQPVAGPSSAYSYSAASGRTVVQTTEPMDADEGETADSVVKTVYTFDDDGNVVSEYMYTEEAGNTGVDGQGSGIHPYAGNGGAGVVSNINNLLLRHDNLNWSNNTVDCGDFTVGYPTDSLAKFGLNVLSMSCVNADSKENYVYQDTIPLPAGRYTFSAYVRAVTDVTGGAKPGAYLQVTGASGAVLAESERVTKKGAEYIRLTAPFQLDAAGIVRVHVMLDGKGQVYVQAAQLENNPYASAYNLLSNSNFENGITSWTVNPSTSIAVSDAEFFNMSQSLRMYSNVDSCRYASQEVTNVKQNQGTRETFTLSGWAKGYGIVDRERKNSNAPKFCLRARVNYTNGTFEDHEAEFSPCTEEWQLASVQFSKEKYSSVKNIVVYCDYSFNSGIAYFDDIQLVRDSVETGLSASDFEVVSTEEVEEDTEEVVTTEEADAFQELLDGNGNALTETTFTDGEYGTIYRSFGFSQNGNDLVKETDARKNETAYAVDAQTSRNEEVTDRCGNKTAYEYDDAGRTTKVTSKDAAGAELAHVSYAYDAFDNLTEIVRGDGMKYALKYNAFHNLEAIGIDGKTEDLVSYTYKNGNGRLKAVTYANGHTMKATYNAIGQMVAEKWFDAEDSLVAHYKYAYDGQGNIVQSVDMTALREYNYTYEEGRIVRAAELAIFIGDSGIATCKTLLNAIRYTYDQDGNLTKKQFQSASGDEQVTFYETSDDNTVVKFTAGGKTVTSHSKTDSFGRKVFDELQLGTGFVSRQFVYHAGQISDEHRENGKLKSSATTQLVSQIILSDGRTISYEYDNEDRIIQVTDSIAGTTEYTYDALGQLVTEAHRAVGEETSTVVNAMTYSDAEHPGRYGNILTKNGVAYTYGDPVWKDLLTGYGDQTITYDKQGNPTSYLGHTLTWEKGRQLKSFGGNTYTYNANGIRTSKTVNGVKHTYELDGTKILSESWGTNRLIPLYDNEDSVCGILYNGTPFYFLKNLQGDIIAITDLNGTTVATYNYDAWGVCTVTSDTSSCNIATINPFRYRGYYYDSETGLYYVSSRYYDPEIGRFLNSDETSYIYADGINYGVNLFAYCENNPVNMYDPNGTIALLTCIIIGAIAGAAIGAIASKMIYGKVNGWWVLGGAIVGGVLGYFGGAFFGASGIKAGTLASKISMSKVRWLGKIGEKMAKWPKNTTRIKSFTGSAKYRIPDYLNKANKVIGDVKNVKKLSYTKQLQDFMLYAEKYGYTYIIKVRQSTQFSSTIKNLIDAGKIIIMYIK
jgi:RHS repeat-associated protein